jgi:hypothetical protein
VYRNEVAVLHRQLKCDDTRGIEVHDELRVYKSKWHANHRLVIAFGKDASCRKVVFAPDGSKLPIGDCFMKLESGCQSLIFKIKGDILVKMQHTSVCFYFAFSQLSTLTLSHTRFLQQRQHSAG